MIILPDHASPSPLGASTRWPRLPTTRSGCAQRLIYPLLRANTYDLTSDGLRFVTFYTKIYDC